MKTKILDKIKAVFCALFRHSHIQESCFGYVSCARCGTQLGDTLAGSYSDPLVVGVACACDVCANNWSKMTWVDRFLAPKPEWIGWHKEYRDNKKKKRDELFAALRAQSKE